MVKYLGNWWLSGTENKVHRRSYHEWNSDSTPAAAAYWLQSLLWQFIKCLLILLWAGSLETQFGRQPQHLFDTLLGLIFHLRI
jgi:hypothetical protein